MFVATGSPQDESVRCADLWPVCPNIASHTKKRPAGPWLQRYHLFKTLWSVPEIRVGPNIDLHFASRAVREKIDRSAFFRLPLPA